MRTTRSTRNMVTRTFTITTFRVMVCDVATGTTSTVEVSTTKKVKEGKELECVKSLIDYGVPVAVLESFTEEKLYGLSEEAFITMAEVLS